MGKLLESLMLISFGCSWPVNILKNIRAKSAKGMSLPFFVLVSAGYAAGIGAKFVSHDISYVLAIYFLNFCMCSSNIPLYFFNRHLDKVREGK